MKTLLLILASMLTTMAADVAGEWKATAEGPNGAMERTLSLKVDGTKLTGETVSSFVGKSVIQEGKVDGDTFSFVISAKIQDNDVKLHYKGKVTGKDTMTLTSEMAGGGGNAIEWKATRVK
ncbi:MAG: hypothetical protein ACKV2U_31230 [Bryobacteraceae bacterium]